MKLDFWKSLTSLEIVLIVLLVIYIVFAIPTPDTFIPFMNSSVGFAIVVIVVIFMVYYTNPILAILSIFVGYELIRRSSYNTMNNTNNNIFSVPVVQSFPINQLEKDVIMKEMNPLQSVTLEEEVINKMAPIGIMDTATFIETSYQPLPDKTVDCAAYYKCSE